MHNELLLYFVLGLAAWVAWERILRREMAKNIARLEKRLADQDKLAEELRADLDSLCWRTEGKPKIEAVLRGN